MEPKFDRKLVRSLLSSVVTAWMIFWTTRFVIRLIAQRRYFRNLQSQGLVRMSESICFRFANQFYQPMPPHSFLFGHIPILIQAVQKLPADAHQVYLPIIIRRLYPDLGPNFYLDVWPFSPALLVLGSPEVWHQVAMNRALEKTQMNKNYLRPLTKGLDIVSLEGPQWKTWRTIFDPGFSPSHLVTLIPMIIQEVSVFCTLLDEHAAAHDVFPLKSLTDNLILDIIIQVTLGTHLKCQTTFNRMAYGLRNQIRWLSTGYENNPWIRYHPLRPFMLWYYGSIVDQYISQKFDEGWTAWQSSTLHGKRTILDLALTKLTETRVAENDKTVRMDADTRESCLSQLKVFLFAGHDTTSSALCSILWLLSQNPVALSQLRDEHESIYGLDTAQTAHKIHQSPQSLNQLPFTTAVIKESLRILPPATTIRQGRSEFNVVDSQGRIFPTEKAMVWSNQHTAHNDQESWSDPESFVPQRWLASHDNVYTSEKDLWRPFGQGSRNCIGQELVMIEMKIILAMITRSYVFAPAYDEIYGGRRPGVPEVLGQKAYISDMLGPKAGIPLRVTKIGK